jgi:hypothetical protein
MSVALSKGDGEMGIPDPPMDVTKRAGVGFQAAWLAVFVGTVILGSWGLWIAFPHPRLIVFPRLIDFLVGFMAERGLSVPMVTILALIIPAVLASLVAIVIFMGRRDDRLALLFGLALACMAIWGSGASVAIRAEAPGWVVPTRIVEAIWLGIGIIGLATFPNGRFVPRWTGWGVAGSFVWLLALTAVSAASVSSDPSSGDPADEPLGTTLFVLFVVLLLVVSQTVRYRRFFVDQERRQSRLVLLAMSLGLVPAAIAGILVMVGASLTWVGWALMVVAFTTWLIPTAVGVAIFRYRLYDVDRIVSLSVSYVVVVSVVAATYGAGVVLLRQLVPGEGDLPVAASTLLVAALFNPVRRRIRRVVDSRFHRSRYDAELILTGFAERLHRRVDLEGMIDESVALVQSTMSPSNAAIWLSAGVENRNRPSRSGTSTSVRTSRTA